MKFISHVASNVTAYNLLNATIARCPISFFRCSMWSYETYARVKSLSEVKQLAQQYQLL